MATNFAGIKQILDVPTWQGTPLMYNSLHVALNAVVGTSLCSDLRASQYKQNLIWFLHSATALYQYRTKGNGWMQLASPTLTGTFGIGAGCVFAPSHGPRGVITAGATTTRVVLSTALVQSVGQNQLAGQRIRIGNNVAGGGQCVERTIIANTAGTSPAITVDSSFGFTPGTSATYELLTGRVYMLSAGTLAAGMWKYYDIATNTYSGNLATTNLPATINQTSTLVCLDELHTPITGVGGVAINGEVGGFFGQLTATAATSTTFTGQASLGDATVLANEYRNFQIRIVEDLTNPTAVGQRRRITSHTAGPSPVYTVPAWTVTPSATAKYMIENNNDILLWSSSSTSTFRYVADAWDTTTYAVAPAARSTGTIAFHPFATILNPEKTIRHSHIYTFRGGAVNSLDIFDIAAAATGTWAGAVPYDNQGPVTINTSSGVVYSAVDNDAMICPVQLSGQQANMYYFDVDKMSLRSYAPCPQISSAPVDGNRLAVEIFVDGTDKKAMFFLIPSGQTYMLRSLFIN